jgi:hypothetical protein
MSNKIAPEVLDVLADGRAEGNRYHLSGQQLDRKLYVAVNEVLTRIGGKWNRKEKAHVFDDGLDAGQLVALVVESTEMPPKNPTAFFPTPPDVADMLLRAPHLPRIPATATRILEPSAGKGALADAVIDYCNEVGISATVDVCEVLPRFRDALTGKGFRLVGDDFLTYTADELYDAIVMNPPFAVESDRLACIAHIQRAWSMLAPGGVLLAIAPGGFSFRDDKRVVTLRELMGEHGAWVAAEDGAFKPSGTDVRTVLIGATKPAADEALFAVEQVA